MIELIEPTISYKHSFLEAIREFKAEGRFEEENNNIAGLENDFPEYLVKLRNQAAGKDLPPGYVPASTFWLVDAGKFIGTVKIRHILNESLLNEGGHIGYEIRPTARQKGYGKIALKLGLLEAKKLGLEKVLVTCDETNIGSRKIIEANRGILEDIRNLGTGKPLKRRYWISLK